MALNYCGAEALVTTCEWNGQPAIEKRRNLRGYRHPDLEVRLVTERLRAEARLLERANEVGLPTPSLYAVDTATATLVMTHLPGDSLEQALRAPKGATWLPLLGELLADIHSAGIIHGDPTTSNFIARGASGGAGLHHLSVIDFGLGVASDDDEQRATDLRVLLESLEAHHPELDAREPLLTAYGEWDGSAGALERLTTLEQRGRYNLVQG